MLLLILSFTSHKVQVSFLACVDTNSFLISSGTTIRNKTICQNDKLSFPPINIFQFNAHAYLVSSSKRFGNKESFSICRNIKQIAIKHIPTAGCSTPQINLRLIKFNGVNNVTANDLSFYNHQIPTGILNNNITVTT